MEKVFRDSFGEKSGQILIFRSFSDVRIGSVCLAKDAQALHFCANSTLLPFQAGRGFARIGAVKFAFSLLILSALALTACNNLVTRRDMYSPAKASGPYTTARRTGKLPSKEQLNAAPKPANAPRVTTEETALPTN